MLLTPEKKRRIEAWFRENFSRRGELGAAVSIWENGRESLSLAGGTVDRAGTTPWRAQTPVLVWSCTKPLAAACLLHAMEKARVPLTTPVAALWSEFAQGGKGAITIAQALSHQAGLAALDTPAPMLDHAAVAAALAAQVPNWAVGGAGDGLGNGAKDEASDGAVNGTGDGAGAASLNKPHGYHPRTFGSLVEEIFRRVEGGGMTLGEYWQKWFAVPLGLDFWMGVPEEKLEAVAPVFAPRVAAASPVAVATDGSAPDPHDPLFYKAMRTPGSLTARAFASPRGFHGPASMNLPEARRASLPAFGGVGTAHSLAKFYAMLAEGGALEGVRFFESPAPVATPLCDGEDLVLLRPTAFSAGFMRDPLFADGPRRGQKIRQLFGPSPTAFGQPGNGGCHAFADPEHRIAFAYVMNQMEPGVMPGEKALGLVERIYG